MVVVVAVVVVVVVVISAFVVVVVVVVVVVAVVVDVKDGAFVIVEMVEAGLVPADDAVAVLGY